MTTLLLAFHLCPCMPATHTRVEAAISAGSLPQLAAQLRQELATLATKDYSRNSLLQMKKQSLIIDMMHSCNVVEGLLAPTTDAAGAASAGGVPTSVKDWAWTRQRRYYADLVGVVGVCGYERIGGSFKTNST